MPELPEVEAIAMKIHDRAIGLRIRSVEVTRGKYLESRRDEIIGSSIVSVRRIGKFIMIDLSSGSSIKVHNAMTGFFDWSDEPWTFDYVEGDRSSTLSDVRVIFSFDGFDHSLMFHDARLFGRMEIVSVDPDVGPEAMSTKLSFDRPVCSSKHLLEWSSSYRRSIKEFIMDQTIVAGIGNIYASEGLSLSGVHPMTKALSVTDIKVWSTILDAVRGCMSFSIPNVEYGWLNVYRQKVCGHCGTNVVRFKLGGRSTFMCSGCLQGKSP